MTHTPGPWKAIRIGGSVMSHTPGEWQAEKAISLGYRVIAVSPDGISVVVENIDNEGRYGAIGESDDALLIAAAPAMLEALEGAKWLIECYVAKPEGYEEYQDVVKAIKKARDDE